MKLFQSKSTKNSLYDKEIVFTCRNVSFPPIIATRREDYLSSTVLNKENRICKINLESKIKLKALPLAGGFVLIYHEKIIDHSFSILDMEPCLT